MTNVPISIVPANKEKTIAITPASGGRGVRLRGNKGKLSMKRPMRRQPSVKLARDSDSSSDNLSELSGSSSIDLQRHGQSRNQRITKDTDFPALMDSDNESENIEFDRKKGGGGEDNFLGDISNPMKRREGVDLEESSDEDNMSSVSTVDNGFQNSGRESGHYEEETQNYEKSREFRESERKRIEDEKQELLYKFYRLEQKGIRSPRKFSMDSSLEDMKIEYNKINYLC